MYQMTISVLAAGILLETAAFMGGFAAESKGHFSMRQDLLERQIEEARQRRTEEVCLLPVEEEPEIGEGYFTFGDIKVALWDGVFAGMGKGRAGREDTAESAQKYVREIDLYGTGGEYDLPPRISLSHYTIQWDGEDPAQEKALMRLLLEQMGQEEEIRCILRGEEQRIYLAQSIYRSYYVLIYGADLYQAGWFRPEGEYGFEALLQEGRVSWQGERKAVIWPGEEQGISENPYFIVQHPEGDTPLLHYAGDRKMEVYREGRYETAAQILTFREPWRDWTAEDLNFDGFPDLCMGYFCNQAFLWQPEQELFVEAQMTDWEKARDRYLFPEEKLVWLYDAAYEAYDLRFCTETFCRWEGNVLVPIRSCTLETDEEQVRLSASEEDSGNILWAQAFDREAWERHPEILRPLYERFYEGLVPAQAYGLMHEMEEEQKYIDQELVDELIRALLQDELEETVGRMEHGRRLTEEQAGEIARQDTEVRLEIESVRYSGMDGLCDMILVDADNDGIEDILAEEYFGGSGGFVHWVLLKGQPDGSFIKTSEYEHAAEKIGVIGYKGRNYLCRIGFFGAEDRRNWGFDLYCYENGSRVERVLVRLRPKEFQTRVAACSDEAYEELAVSAGEKCAGIYENIICNRIMTGSAEQKNPDGEGTFQCDLDNDGVSESYRKSFWSVEEYKEWLFFSCEDNASAGDAIYDRDDPLMMWVEEYRGENIVHVMYLTGFLEYEIVGYKIGSDGFETVFVTECMAAYEAEQRTQRQMSWLRSNNPSVLQ